MDLISCFDSNVIVRLAEFVVAITTADGQFLSTLCFHNYINLDGVVL